MTEQFKNQLQSAGVDVSGALNRFMNNEDRKSTRLNSSHP